MIAARPTPGASRSCWPASSKDGPSPTRRGPGWPAPARARPRPAPRTAPGARCAHAARARQRLRARHLPKTPSVNRARLRSHQTQSQDLPLQLSRPAGGPHRVAINHVDSQPDQAPPPPNRHRRGLKRPQRSSHRRSGRERHQSRCQQSATSTIAARFERQPHGSEQQRWVLPKLASGSPRTRGAALRISGR